MRKNESQIPEPFDPEEFRKKGHKVIDILAEYLKDALSGKEMAVLPWNDPEKLTEIFSFGSGGGEKESLADFIKRIIDFSNHLHHPHYIGHQVTSPLPLTTLVQLCTTLLNNGAAIYEMGPVAMAMEKNIIQLFGSLIGYKTAYDGIFTHGGTAGNLTAMLAARQAKTDYNIWEEGVTGCRASGFHDFRTGSLQYRKKCQDHGTWRNDSIIRVPVGSAYKMETGLLEKLKSEAEDKGLKVISVVASACSTATGSYDDLNDDG